MKPAWLATLLGFRLSFSLPGSEQVEDIGQVVSFCICTHKMKLPIVMALGCSTKICLSYCIYFPLQILGKNFTVVMDLPFDLQSIPCRTGIKDSFKSLTIRALGEQMHSYRVYCRSYCSVYSAEQL